MNILFSKLQQASDKMPRGIPPETSGRLIITLLFFKIISDLGAGAAGHADSAMRINMPPAYSFNACLETTPPRTAATVHETLCSLVALQAHGMFNGVFFPDDFMQLGRMFELAGNTTGLSDVVQLIGSLDFSGFLPSPPLVGLFARACHACHCGPPLFVTRAAPLMAQLLQPSRGERVIDPACGQGTLLTACAALLAKQEPGAALGLAGTESGERDFAMTKMHFFLAGLPLVRLKKADVLDAPQLLKSQFGTGKADMVITALPHHARPWHHALAFAEHDRRFPVQPPADSRVALFWHALACLKNEGRMAVLVPPDMLECEDSRDLRQHLIEKNLLEAVITLPMPSASLRGQLPKTRQPIARPAPLLLLIHRKKLHGTVAFIAPGAAGKYQQNDIVDTYRAWLCRQVHPHLANVENGWFAKNDFALHPRRLLETYFETVPLCTG